MSNTCVFLGRLVGPAMMKRNNNGESVALFNVADNWFNPKEQKNIPSFFFFKATKKNAVKVEGYKQGDLINITATASTYTKVNDYGDNLTHTIYFVTKIERVKKATVKNAPVQELEENVPEVTTKLANEKEVDFIINNM